MASGGVNLENAAEFIKSGVNASGLGGGLIPKSNGEFDQCAAHTPSKIFPTEGPFHGEYNPIRSFLGKPSKGRIETMSR
jgi:hypothetical protein